MKFKDIQEARTPEALMKDLNGLLDDAARGLRQAERAMQSAVKVRVPVSNATVPMQKALRKVELAKKAVMDLPI